MSEQTIQNTLTWKAYEHKHKGDKSTDWYWTLGLVVLSIAIASILLGNSLFALLIIVAASALGLSANQKSIENSYTINTRGISINERLYPYKNLEAFWIDETRPGDNVLIIDAQQSLVPHLIINIPSSIDPNTVQDYLLDYLPEDELYESPAQRIGELFGF